MRERRIDVYCDPCSRFYRHRHYCHGNGRRKEQIANVTVQLDGLLLDEVDLVSGTESYTRAFSQVGGSQPGMDHMLVVTAADAGGAPHSATTRWRDN